MAKSKKNKQPDFQKVKLKVGKRLPKGQNVTNTSFKTRRIQVVQQIKSDSLQPTTHRRLNIAELLTKCQHYSISIRHEGMTGIRELVTLYPQTATSHLSSIIEKALPLITDKDCNVRQATFRLFKVVFPKVPANQIEPFFPVLSAHLCCAMTHIYEDVQHDSLELFDVLLEAYPDLIGKSSDQLLQNFIEQISRRHSFGKKGTKSAPSLAVRPDSKLSAQRWRSGILSRVHKLLSALLSWKFPEKAAIPDPPVYVDCHRIPFQSASSVTMPWTQPGYKLQTSHARAAALKAGNLSEFASSLIPLLVQCWVECRSTQGYGKQQAADNLVSPASVSVMFHVMSVLHLLWLCVEREDRSIYGQHAGPSKIFTSHQRWFCQHFLDHFPYSLQEHLDQKVKAKNKKKANMISSEALNLAVCEVMTFLVSTETCSDGKTTPVTTSVGRYLCTCLESCDLGPELNKKLVHVLQRFCEACSVADLMEAILGKAFVRYTRVHPLSTEKRLYLELFNRLFLDTNRSVSNDVGLTDQFFQSLPELLLRIHSENHQVAAYVIEVMRQAASQNCRPLLATLQDRFMEMIDENGMFTDANEKLQKSLLEILCCLPAFSPELLSTAVRVCHHPNVCTSVSLYLLSVLHYRFSNEISKEIADGSGVAMTTAYLTFLMSVLVGGKKIDSQATSTGGFVWVESVERFDKHVAVVKKVFQNLNHLPDVAGLAVMLCPVLEQMMRSNNTIPLTTGFGLLECLQQLQAAGATPARSLLDTSANLCFSLTLELVAKESADSHMTPVTNQMWDCVMQCLSGCSDLMNCYFLKVEESLQECDQETCRIVLTAIVHILQSQSCNLVPVGRHLGNIQNVVMTTLQEVLETKEWKDFVYIASVNLPDTN